MAVFASRPCVQTLVIRNTRSRRSLMAFPIRISLLPSWYSHALSRKVTPPSIAAWMSFIASASVLIFPMWSPPRPRAETWSECLPNGRRGISSVRMRSAVQARDHRSSLNFTTDEEGTKAVEVERRLLRLPHHLHDGRQRIELLADQSD